MLHLWMAMAAGAAPCDDEGEVAARSAEIKAIYDAGEAERADRSADAKSVLKRDEARVKQVASLDKQGQLCTADDKWYAAWVMTQADSEATLERAHELAQEAMAAHHGNGAWLVAFTFDLKRVFGGYLQSFGTQTRVNERGQRCLIQVEPDFTDEQRKEYGQPPLAEAYRKILDANGFQGDEATLDRVERRGLSCPPLAGSRKAQRRVRAPSP
jgi:hypothetical protein